MKAFTLVELLVVIAIIALLASLLFPVFAQAKEVAKRTASLSNVKQITLSQFLYMDDNDDAVAMNRDCTLVINDLQNQAPCEVGKGARGWIDLTVIYVKSYRIFKSPGDPTEPVPLPRGTVDYAGKPILDGYIFAPRPNGISLGGEYRCSYARNNNFANNGTYTARASMAQNPTTLVLVYSFAPNAGAGANGNEGVPGASFTIVRRPEVVPEPNSCVPYSELSTGNAKSNFWSQLPQLAREREMRLPSSERYRGLGLYGFADGHAKAFPPERIFGQCSWGVRPNGVEMGNNRRDPDFRF